jgi:hypothetical protein
MTGGNVSAPALQASLVATSCAAPNALFFREFMACPYRARSL